MNHRSDLYSNIYSKLFFKRTIDLFIYRKINLFKMINHLKIDFFNSKNHLYETKKHLNTNQKNINHLKLFICIFIICFIDLSDAARVYKGKKHTTNSPIYYISAPFLPNRSINQFPPPPQTSQFSHSSNILSSVYSNLNSNFITSTTISPLNMITKSFDKKINLNENKNQFTSNILNRTTNLESSIANYLLKASLNPNSFINKLNTSSPEKVTKIKLKRRKLNRNSTLPNISQPIKTINVNFSIYDLKKTFNNFKQQSINNENNKQIGKLVDAPDKLTNWPNKFDHRSDQLSIDNGFENKIENKFVTNIPQNKNFKILSTHQFQFPKHIETIESISKKQTAVSSVNTGDKSLNLLGEIILNRYV